MKKMILSLMSAMLSCATFAANCVSVQQISTDYANHKITIALTRSGCTGDATNHRNTVWVFIDYRTVTGATKGAWTRATVSATSSGTVVNSGSSKGVWINGANGTQTVTLTLSGMPAKYDWCAFATDYPPNVAATGGVYTFKGTPPFVLQPATGAAQTVTQTTLATTALTVIPVSIRDATGCTGTFCPYSGSDLYMDATHICQLRTSGAKNWEAYIKDSRDNNIYRMVQMPTGSWWMAQDLLWDGKPNPTATGYTVVGTARACGTWLGCGRRYSESNLGAQTGAGARRPSAVCPSGWMIPSANELIPYTNQPVSSIYLSAGEFGGPDTYGLSLFVCSSSNHSCGNGEMHIKGSCGHQGVWYRNSPGTSACVYACGCKDGNYSSVVRCVRSL